MKSYKYSITAYAKPHKHVIFKRQHDENYIFDEDFERFVFNVDENNNILWGNVKFSEEHKAQMQKKIKFIFDSAAFA